MSSIERTNPPPRRKSCDACRAAKRRCDLALPACLRCTRRNIPCAYPGLPAPDLIPEMLALLSEPVGTSCVTAEEFDFAPLQGFSFDALLDVHSQLQVQTCPLDQLQYSSPMVYLTGNHEMTHVRTGTKLSLDDLMASRFQYAIDILRDTPRMMVMENQTPWSHRELYRKGMPRAMQDAYACCALYITKNPLNAPMVTSHIHSRHQELLFSPLPTEGADLLAYTQALLLYLIMHLFDPDLNNVNSASSLDTLSMSALETTASLLFNTTHFPPEPEPEPEIQPNTLTPTTITLPPNSPSATPFWTLWTTEESARRTILFTFYFLNILRLLRGEHSMQCDGKLGILHSWYLSAYLWNAGSAIEFAAAWAGREHFIVRNVNFENVLAFAGVDDVDCFGRMLLVTSRGVDRVREWFGGKGGVL
ncbi:hypothetical protein BJX99DRAFT_133816 [Aspergillus californicus]